jgi:YD repeat-containing protein
LIETIAYGYSNTQWGDLLTSFNGSTITYDAMGNPTSYLGKTLSWEGKRLTSYTNGSTSITYAYNEDGLRLNKTVGSNKTEYYYNGSVLMYMITGSENADGLSLYRQAYYGDDRQN